MPPRPSAAEPAVRLDGDTMQICALAVTHAEATRLAGKFVEVHGADALTDLVRRALPIGIMALTLGAATLDTGSMQRTLDVFAGQVDAASTAALGELERATAALRAGEADLANRAARVLERLPERVEAALAGEAANVRAQVGAAAAEVQAAGLAEMRTAMAAHAEIVRTAVSLDTTGGPIRALREEVLAMVDSSRTELSAQLAAVHVLLTAAQASTAAVASVKSTRQSGMDFESAAMSLAEQIVTASGDVMQVTGSVPAPGGGSRRSGDGVAVLSHLLSGKGRTLRIVLEAKTRSTPLSAAKWFDELTASRDLRQASAGLAIVPDASQVPGGDGRLWAKVGERLMVVAADTPAAVALVYQVLRELTALEGGHRADTELDVGLAESRISQALTALNDLDDVARHSAAAQKSIERIREVSMGVRTRVEETLRASLGALGSK